MSFWETFWVAILWCLWATIFIAYLMALFSILTDIIRDRDQSGWAKAIWILFLIFVPFLTALVYLVTRGEGMSRRSAQAMRQNQEAADDYIRTVAGTDSASQIEKAKSLLDAGAITQAEYDQLKAKALAG